VPVDCDLFFVDRLRTASASSSRSAMNCSTVMDDLGDLAVGRFIGAALFPVDDGEAFLERRMKATTCRISGKPGRPCSVFPGCFVALPF
jgi:hypothetical protein